LAHGIGEAFASLDARVLAWLEIAFGTALFFGATFCARARARQKPPGVSL
jgi:uncharacterized membrane protein